VRDFYLSTCICEREIYFRECSFYILESVVFAHEILHDAIKNKKGLVLKLDYEKVYDRVISNAYKKCYP
jgi:hypothetical protein